MKDSQEEKTELLQAFVWRLNRAAESAGLSQVELAGKLGVTRSRVGNWFQGNNFPKKAERVALARLLNVTLEWLMHGDTEQNLIRPGDIEKARATYGGTPVREVPVISWSHAGEAVAYEEMPRHFHGRVSTTTSDPKAFAVVVEGDSMEPKIFAGDRVVCEPSRAPLNGKPVVAKHQSDDVRLRLYHQLADGTIRLSAYNPLYPPMDYKPQDFLWIYPVKELIRGF